MHYSETKKWLDVIDIDLDQWPLTFDLESYCSISTWHPLCERNREWHHAASTVSASQYLDKTDDDNVLRFNVHLKAIARGQLIA